MESVADGCKAILYGFSRWLPRRGHRAKKAGETNLQILALMPHGPDSLLLHALARDAGLCLTVSDAAVDLVFPRASDVPPIVIIDRQHFPNRWKRIVRALSRNSPRPCIILLSPRADANLWDELQRVGGSDILRHPITREHLEQALERAAQLWRNQQRAHSLLSESTK
jgi:FixJ family two-component response regulator